MRRRVPPVAAPRGAGRQDMYIYEGGETHIYERGETHIYEGGETHIYEGGETLNHPIG